MKNFRKVLALVLVVATLFSFAAMAGAANIGEYEDWSDVSYAEAVDVLSAVGILNGYEVADDEFEFHPTDKISREEMAKMIAVLANSGKDISKLYATAVNFADVAKDRWSASYIAYCAKTGIVAGRSANTFDPQANVTGLETAKMLLVLLGFNAKTQGYEYNADWKVNILKDAKVMGLLNGFAASYDIEAAITREEAANMMLNALCAPCVLGIKEGKTVKLTNALVFSKLDEQEEMPVGMANVTSYAMLMDAIKLGNWALYDGFVITDDILYEKLFNGNLTKEGVAQRDCFGRPATAWKWTDSLNNVTYLANTVATPVWESLTATPASIKVVTDKYAKVDSTPTQYVDGVADATVNGGNGAYVAAYLVGGELTLVEINTYMGTVAHIKYPTGKVTITTGGTNYDITNTYGFTTADCGNTTVMLWKCKDGVHAVEVLEPKAVKLHGAQLNLDTFCDTDEGKYTYNVTATAKATNGDMGKNAYLYLDKNGYVLGVAWATAKKTVSVLAGGSALEDLLGWNSAGVDKYKYTAKFVEFDANPAKGDALAVTEDMFDEDKYFSYVTDENGHPTSATYNYDVLVKWTETATGARDVAAVADVATPDRGSDYMMLKKGLGTVSGFAALAGDENTQYIIRLYNAETGAYEYKYFDGCDEIDGNYKVEQLQYFKAYEGDAHLANRYFGYVYADVSAEYVNDIAFLNKFYTEEIYNAGGDEIAYYLYDAIVNGEQAYVALDKAYLESMPTNLMTLAAHGNAAGTDGKQVRRVIETSFKRVIADTHNDKPIYIAWNTFASMEGSEFVISGNVMSYKKADNTYTTLQVATDAQIVIVADYKAGNTLYKDEIVKVKDYTEMLKYLSAHGWSQQFVWFDTNAAGAVDIMYLYVEEA